MANNFNITIHILDVDFNFETEELSLLLEIGERLYFMTKHISEIDYDPADWWKGK